MADHKPTYEELEEQNRALKKQNNALNRYYRSVVDNSLDAILLTAPDGNVFFANQAACDLFQMTQQEIIDGGRMAVLDKADDRLPKALEVREKTGRFVGELNYKKKDGTIFPGEVSSAIYKDTDGRLFTSMIIRDITEWKKTEKALRDSEERHKLFYNPSFGGSIIHDQGVILDCSKGIANVTGYSHDELIGMDGLRLIAPEWRDFVRDKISSGFGKPYEAEGIRKDGTIFPVRLHAENIQYHGKTARVVEFRDSTELKKKEEALKESETFLNETNKIAKIGGWNYDVKNKKAVWTKEMYHIHEVPYDFVPEVNRDIVFYDERSGEILTQALNEAIANAKPYDLELKFITAKNNKKYVRTIGRPKKDKDGKVFSVGGIFQDITEKKKAELALKASEERFRTLVDTNPFPIVVVDPKHEKILFWSKSAQELFGYEPKTPAEWFSLAYPDPQYRQAAIDRSKPYLEQAQHSKTAVNTGEYQIVCRDGSVKICEIYAQFIPDYLILTNNDITERKQAEQALKESENLLRNIINTSTDYIFAKDKNLKTMLCNKTFAQAVNKKPSDLIGKTDIENGWDVELVKGNSEKRITGYEQADLDALNGKIVRTTDTATIAGEPIFLDSVKIPLKDENNKIFGILGISRDITEQKRAEQALKETMLDLKLAQQIATIGNWQFDPEIGIPVWSEAIYTIYERDPALGPPRVDEYKRIYDEEQYAIFSAAFQRAVEDGIPYNIELRLKLPQNRVKWVQAICQPTEKKGDAGYFLRGTIQDITERKQLEAEKDALITELEQALTRVKKLEGFLPICSYCKKIRDDQGDWQQIETYIHERSDAEFSHGICPECLKAHYPDFYTDT